MHYELTTTSLPVPVAKVVIHWWWLRERPSPGHGHDRRAPQRTEPPRELAGRGAYPGRRSSVIGTSLQEGESPIVSERITHWQSAPFMTPRSVERLCTEPETVTLLWRCRPVLRAGAGRVLDVV